MRGIALLGMILVHFHQNLERPAEGAEGLVGWFIWIGVEQKSWGLFALLFGAGFAVLLRRLEMRDAPVARIYLRRMAGLLLFGFAVEALFGFWVLIEYAVWGVPLLLIRKWSTRALLVTAVVAVAARPLYFALTEIHAWYELGAEGAAAAARAANAGARAVWEALSAAETQSSYPELVRARLAYMGVRYLHWTGWFPSPSFVLFIIGLLAVRHGVLDEPLRHVRLIVAWMAFGLFCFLAYWLLLRNVPELMVPRATWTVRYGFGVIQEQWLTLTYGGALLLLLAYRPAWTTRLSWFGVVGRMALTNYVLQAAVLDFLGSGYGLGLRLRPWLVLVATVALFAAVVAFSRWWLGRNRMGPLEWLWRCITYARMQPLRATPSSTVSVAP